MLMGKREGKRERATFLAWARRCSNSFQGLARFGLAWCLVVLGLVMLATGMWWAVA